MFFDLNLKSENENLEKARNFFLRVANFHKVSLSDSMSNEEYIRSKNEQFPSSPFANQTNILLESYQPDTLEIQTVLSENSNL